MEEPRKKAAEKKKTASGDMRKYIEIALVTFITFCCCILVFFLIYRYQGFTTYFHKLMNILQPFIIGLIIAYLINPVMVFIESHVKRFLLSRMKNERKARKTARSIGTAGALLFFLMIIFLLLYMMIPELIESVQNMIRDLPIEINAAIIRIQKVFADDSELAGTLGTGLRSITSYLENFMQEQILPRVNMYIASITTGVVSGLLVVFNFLIGLVVAVYVLMSKETFIGQSKKIVYAVFSPNIGNKIVKTIRVSNQMFGGFISGKILDSAIIGVICYIGLVIMKMPYSLLVAVVVGVTNVLPFFGPYVGAVPSFILIALANPMKGLYFLIFILVLQQIDGNIIGPKILGDSTGLNSFWVLFAILVGGGLFGFMGMLLGVPTFAVIYYLLREIIGYILRRKKLPESTKEYIHAVDVDVDKKELRYEEEKQVI